MSSALFLVCGIPEDKLVEAHGSFATASCHLCYTPFPADEAKVMRKRRLTLTALHYHNDHLYFMSFLNFHFRKPS